MSGATMGILAQSSNEQLQYLSFISPVQYCRDMKRPKHVCAPESCLLLHALQGIMGSCITQCAVQSNDEKDKLRSSLGSSVMEEKPNIKVRAAVQQNLPQKTSTSSASATDTFQSNMGL